MLECRVFEIASGIRALFTSSVFVARELLPSSDRRGREEENAFASQAALGCRMRPRRGGRAGRASHEPSESIPELAPGHLLPHRSS